METLIDEVIFVPGIEPRLKHATIFQKFDELTDKHSVIIENDHDPKPLYYQFIAERGPIFNWEYLENGPEVWKVKLTKTLTEKSVTVGELVAADFRKAEVFKKYGIDFCCGGKKSLKETCEKKGLDVVEIERELNEISATSNTDYNFQNMPLNELVDYIIEKHHGYVNRSIPVLEEYLTKLVRVHGDRHPELKEVFNKFENVKTELVSHMYKEENVLFPYIKMLVEKSNSAELFTSPFGSIKNPINMMDHEHETVGEFFEQINEITNSYTPPADACTTYKVGFLKLKEFEDDLHVHIHLESNILFPKSIELESKVVL